MLTVFVYLLVCICTGVFTILIIINNNNIVWRLFVYYLTLLRHHLYTIYTWLAYSLEIVCILSVHGLHTVLCTIRTFSSLKRP